MEQHKLAEIKSRQKTGIGPLTPFRERGTRGFSFTRYATVMHAFETLGLNGDGASLLDVGCGTGWSSVFLAQRGFAVTGVDIVPANIQGAQTLASRWKVQADFRIADMEYLDLDQTFDCALVYNSLHHTRRQRTVLRTIYRHLKPGGWLLIGEPSWLHRYSADGRSTSDEKGWVERGVTMRGLRRDCRAAGFRQLRRYFEGTHPASGMRELAWQALRLAGMPFSTSPSAMIWLAAQSERSRVNPLAADAIRHGRT